MALSPTARRWAKLVTALESSNLTAAAFAAQNNVNPSTLSWWRSRLSRFADFSQFSAFGSLPALPHPAVGYR